MKSACSYVFFCFILILKTVWSFADSAQPVAVSAKNQTNLTSPYDSKHTGKTYGSDDNPPDDYWHSGIPVLVSWMLFNNSLPDSLISHSPSHMFFDDSLDPYQPASIPRNISNHSLFGWFASYQSSWQKSAGYNETTSSFQAVRQLVNWLSGYFLPASALGKLYAMGYDLLVQDEVPPVSQWSEKNENSRSPFAFSPNKRSPKNNEKNHARRAKADKGDSEGGNRDGSGAPELDPAKVAAKLAHQESSILEELNQSIDDYLDHDFIESVESWLVDHDTFLSTRLSDEGVEKVAARFENIIMLRNKLKDKIPERLNLAIQKLVWEDQFQKHRSTPRKTIFQPVPPPRQTTNLTEYSLVATSASAASTTNSTREGLSKSSPFPQQPSAVATQETKHEQKHQEEKKVVTNTPTKEHQGELACQSETQSKPQAGSNLLLLDYKPVIPIVLEDAGLLAACPHPNHLLLVGSWDFAQLPPTCISNSNGDIPRTITLLLPGTRPASSRPLIVDLNDKLESENQPSSDMTTPSHSETLSLQSFYIIPDPDEKSDTVELTESATVSAPNKPLVQECEFSPFTLETNLQGEEDFWLLGNASTISQECGWKLNLDQIFKKHLQTLKARYCRSGSGHLIQIQASDMRQASGNLEKLLYLPELLYIHARTMKWDINNSHLFETLFHARFYPPAFEYLVMFMADPESPFFQPFSLVKIAKDMRAAAYPGSRIYDIPGADIWPSLGDYDLKLRLIYKIMSEPDKKKQSAQIKQAKEELLTVFNATHQYHAALLAVLIQLDAFSPQEKLGLSASLKMDQQVLPRWLRMALEPLPSSKRTLLDNLQYIETEQANTNIPPYFNMALHLQLFQLHTDYGPRLIDEITKFGRKYYTAFDVLIKVKNQSLYNDPILKPLLTLILLGSNSYMDPQVALKGKSHAEKEEELKSQITQENIKTIALQVLTIRLFKTLQTAANIHLLSRKRSGQLATVLPKEILVIFNPVFSYYQRLLLQYKITRHSKYLTAFILYKKDEELTVEQKTHLSTQLQEVRPGRQ